MDLETRLLNQEQVAFDRVESLDHPWKAIGSPIELVALDHASESVGEHVVFHEIAVDHRADVVAVGAGVPDELRDHDVSYVEHDDVEVVQANRVAMPGRLAGQQWDGRTYDIDVDAASFGDACALASERFELGSNRAGHLVCLEDIAVLRATLVLRLEEEGVLPDDLEKKASCCWRGAPVLVNRLEKILNLAHVPASV